MKDQPTCITEVIESELRAEIRVLTRKLEAARYLIKAAELAYGFASEKNHMTPLEDIPGYLELKKRSE